jgi:hypothetical protein
LTGSCFFLARVPPCSPFFSILHLYFITSLFVFIFVFFLPLYTGRVVTYMSVYLYSCIHIRSRHPMSILRPQGVILRMVYAFLFNRAQATPFTIKMPCILCAVHLTAIILPHQVVVLATQPNFHYHSMRGLCSPIFLFVIM